ncbi:MAG: PEGA domain-containing protein [Prevotella sp.]|nr:PEGA domain-containing protein [Prevotella sp.]
MKNKIDIWERLLMTAFALFIFSNSFSQGFKVKEFKPNINDGSAFNAPMDSMGHSCGLIKVRTDSPDLHFVGDIVGDVENKMNEYWVYMPQGSQSLKINHPNFMPLSVTFANYGIEISPKATYILTLAETKFKKEKTGLTIVVKPEDAQLMIASKIVDNLSGHGFYQLYLPKGEYICILSKEGYRPNSQIVKTGKTSQNINVELESVMAELEVKCKTETAEIYIDGKLKGNGTWKGEMLAGNYQIEARQNNFESCTQTVTLAEKESRTFVMPTLKRTMGKLRIETEPSNLPVNVDGKSVGLSPCTIDIETGKHYASSKHYGMKNCRTDVEVNSGRTEIARIKIEYEDGWLKEDYQKGYNGNTDAILSLACQACVIGNYEEAIFWINRHPDKEKVICYWNERYGEQSSGAYWKCDWISAYCEIGNPEKALELFPYIQNDSKDMLVMSYIGDAFYKKKNYDKAISCYQKAGEHGYEGLGDCYAAKGDKQKAAIFYRKSLNTDVYGLDKKSVEKKLKDLGY